MKNGINYLLLVLAAVSLCIACSSKDEGSPADNFDVRFDLPTLINAAKGGEYTFTVPEGGGNSPLTTDSFILESETGISYVCSIVKTSSQSFTVRLAAECETGYYKVFIKRDTRKKSYGRTYLKIVEDIGFTPDEGTTVYGVVSSAGSGVPNVVVSDGAEVTVTDERGIYQLKSAKKWGYVFISVPSGYEVPSDGVLPKFHDDLKGGRDVVERVDFSLVKINQDAYKVFMLGDMHLANRTSDSRQFSEFTSDLTAYMGRHSGERMYAITLGDMTWDLYWYSNKFYFPEYLSAINAQVKGLQIFHTMGNHDNDFKTTSDFDAATTYVNYIAPTYYSFNIGKVHYVVLDDIDCSNYDGTDSRDYDKRLSTEQLNWLAKDLAYVDKATPLVITTHAQIFYPSGVSGFKIDHDVANTTSLFNILDGYKVHFVTGHTHMIFNVTPDAPIVGGRGFHEHNSGSVCASWWWSDHLTPGVHISIDGTPGGYAVWDVSGTDFKWTYKSTGWPEDYQFRSYDLNNVHFSMADVPLMPSSVPASVKNAYLQYVDAYPANSRNEVLINIWNWSSDWTLKVTTETGSELTPTQVEAYDPLHIAALSVKRFNNEKLTSTPSFITKKFTHFFKVKAPDADTDLVITVTDEFGNTWTENMQRPKAFSTDAYKRQ